MVNDFRMMAMLRSDDAGASLRGALVDVAGLDLVIKSDTLTCVTPQLLNGSAPNVLLVDMTHVDSKELTALAQIISKKQGQMAVIATAKHADINSIRTLMRIGVADFIPQPFNKQDVVNALAAARCKLEGAPHMGGAVLAFISSGGGVGTTTLAIQTAADLLTKDKKARNKVCLIDFDLQFGNVALSLDLQTEVGLRQVIENPERLDDEFLAGVVSHHGSGIDVLAAPNLILPLEIITPDLAQHVISWARRHYDCVVIDMPSNWTSWTSFVLKDAHIIMMVTDISVTGVQRCQRQFNLLAEHQIDDVPLAIIANRVYFGFGSKNVAKQAETALGRKIQCFVRADPETANAARDQGVLLSDVKSGSRIVKDLHEFLARVRPALAAVQEGRVVQILGL